MSYPEGGPRADQIPDPFSDRPTEPGAGGGCGKPALIGCGVVVLLLLAGLVFFVTRVESILAWSLRQHRDTVMANLPDDVSAAERERLETAFGALITALESGEVDREHLPDLQRVLLRTSGRIDRLRRSDAIELTEALERAAGIEPPAELPGVAEPAGTETTAALRARGAAASRAA